MDISKIISLLDEIEDESSNEIEVVAFSIREALEIASKELNTEVFNLDYEILETGSSGFLGIGRKPYRVVVRKIGAFSFKTTSDSVKEEVLSIDGKFFVANTNEGVFLKVLPPQGKGRYVTHDDIINELKLREISGFDDSKIRKEVQFPSSTSVLIAPPQNTPFEEDSKPHIEVLPDESRVFLTLSKPSQRGKVPSVSEIKELLKSNGVVYGISDESIEKAIYEGIFGVPVEVAVWTPPEPGKDAKINYYVNIDNKSLFSMISQRDNVDFHKITTIENVVKGQILASKELPTQGKPGRTVRGRIVPTTDGKDINLRSIAGKNVDVSPDGLELIAKENGQVVVKQDKIHIEPVLEITSDVSTETGDIDFVGNVVIKGSVKDTFKVKAGGNVDVWGTVEKAEIIADGNIIVRTGVQGKELGKVVAGGDVIAKFIERANIRAGGNVIALEYIMHSNISSKSRVICLGKKASIVGGTVKAFYEVSAKQLGAESWVETVVEVGSDPDLQERHLSLLKRRDELSNKISEIKKEFNTFQQMIQNFGKVPPDKEERYNTIASILKEYSQELEAIEKELKEIHLQLESAVVEAKVNVRDICYPNVKIKIKDALYTCREQYKFVTFKLENRSIIAVPYEESQEIREKKKEMMEKKKFW
ncbi:MAG: FapA family protein [Brevinematia bacterium]